MIFPAIDIMRVEMSSAGINAELGNIGEIVSGTGNNHGSGADIIISLINIEEVRMSRDPLNYIKKDSGILMKNPAIHLNLTLLFTSVRHEGGYGIALQNVQQVIEFFQKKPVFNHSNTAALAGSIEKLVMNMVSYSLEQLHQLWSMLGGRYHPSVAYIMRMITVDSVTDQPGILIKEIEAHHHLK
jgi:hypothetical protein